MREAGVSTHTKLEVARAGGLPMRNNVGVAIDATGRAIRYGLMNTSKQENEKFKSSDIIAAIPIVVEPWHVGRIFGVIAALETKHPGWHLTPGDQRGHGQLNFINLIRGVGGIAGFITDPAQVQQYIRTFTGVSK